MSLPNELLPAGLIGYVPAVTGYNISRSLRFNSPDSAYLSRTPSVAGNRKTWTWAGWVKRSALGTLQTIFFGGTTTSNTGALSVYFSASDTIGIDGYYNSFLVTSAVFRDTSSWYHIVISLDTTQATVSSRLRAFVNGTEITSFSTDNRSTYVTQNIDLGINQSQSHTIGSQAVASPLYFSGYFADVHFIDGQALTPTSFGQFDSNGVWQPKAYSGTYGLVSVSSATGGLPIYNTTDTYGAVKGSGTRTDSNASSILLAIPMDGANNGTTFTDVSPTIRGNGSPQTISVFGNASTKTAQSIFYGSSVYLDGNGDYLTVPYSTNYNFTGDFTIECWVNFSALPSTATYGMKLASVGDGNSSGWYFTANSDNKIYFVPYGWNSGGINSVSTVTTSKWYHLAVVRSSGTVTIYVNGVAEASGSKTGTTGNSGNTAFHIGTYSGSAGDIAHTLNGYIQDFRVYSGVAKYTSNFTPVVSQVNSFRLDFSDNSNTTAATLGADRSGNGNNWTPNNFSVTAGSGNDSLVDSPTNYGTDTGAGGEVRGNYCTLSPITVTSQGLATLSNGNLDSSGSGSSYTGNVGTIAVSSGKWYWESTIGAFSNGSVNTGIINSNSLRSADGPTWGFGSASDAWLRTIGGTVFNNGGNSITGLPTLTTGDILSVALDMDSGKLWFGKNGVWDQSGNPATGTNPTVTFSPSGKFFYPCVQGYTSSGSWANTINFGSRSFAYAAPSGFKALCTQNLPTPTIPNGRTAMDVVTYTGNSSTQSITSLGFSPDLVWLKSRSAGTGHALYDSIRGPLQYLGSESTSNELTIANTLTSLDAAGFTLGSYNGLNASATTYVGWTWDAGTTTVTNTAGSITSQVRANASAGISIVSWTSNAANAIETMGHGLGATPAFIITRNRDITQDWATYHSSFTSANSYLLLNTTAGITNAALSQWSTSSTTFGLRQAAWATGSQKMIAYCFAPVSGFSAFGSYTGNGSADGPFVYTGFRPRWLLIKRTDSTYGWSIIDTARDSYNLSNAFLTPNSSGAEASGGTSDCFDILSNGFKVRSSTGAATNAFGGTYIYAAFAENPFSISRAR